MSDMGKKIRFSKVRPNKKKQLSEINHGMIIDKGCGILYYIVLCEICD
jgi:hypothetical protein